MLSLESEVSTLGSLVCLWSKGFTEFSRSKYSSVHYCSFMGQLCPVLHAAFGSGVVTVFHAPVASGVVFGSMHHATVVSGNVCHAPCSYWPRKCVLCHSQEMCAMPHATIGQGNVCCATVKKCVPCPMQLL
jgi:hypothetical protein